MLTVPEVAKMLGRNPETIRRWIRTGKLPARKIGTQHLIDDDDLSLVGYRPFERHDEPETVVRDASIVETIRRSRAERGVRLAEAAALYRASSGNRSTRTIPDLWLPALVGRIVRTVDPRQIILFGSRAHGTTSPESDYDLLVLLDELPDRRGTRLSIRRSLADLGIPVDIVVAATAELAPGRRGPRGIVQWAAEQGHVVYERA